MAKVGLQEQVEEDGSDWRSSRQERGKICVQEGPAAFAVDVLDDDAEGEDDDDASGVGGDLDGDMPAGEVEE